MQRENKITNMNLEQIIDQWIGEEKEEIKDSGETRVSGAMYAYDKGYNSALQDLKSRKQELVEGIVEIIKNVDFIKNYDKRFRNPAVLSEDEKFYIQKTKENIIKALTDK